MPAAREKMRQKKQAAALPAPPTLEQTPPPTERQTSVVAAPPPPTRQQYPGSTVFTVENIAECLAAHGDETFDPEALAVTSEREMTNVSSP